MSKKSKIILILNLTMEPYNFPHKKNIRNLHTNQIKVNKLHHENKVNNKYAIISINNYKYKEDDKFKEVKNYGGNNYLYYSNNYSRKENYKMNNIDSRTNKIIIYNNRSWQFEPNKLYSLQKEGLESKIDNLIDNINKYNYKIDMERIESKKQHANLINELRTDRALSEQNLNHFMNEMKKERNIFMDEMKKERIQSNQQHKEIIDVLNKTLNKNM